MAVDALVGVASEEQVLALGGDEGAQETPLDEAEVLGLVDDDLAYVIR